jgi:tight adherence protein C
MIPIGAFFWLALTAVAVFIVAAGLFPDTDAREAEARLGLQGVESREVSPVVEALYPVISLFVPLVKSVGVPKYRASVDQRFTTAGMTGKMTSDEFIAYKVVCIGLFWGLFIGVLCHLITGWQVGPILQLFACFLGFQFPEAWLNGAVRERQDEIRRSLPYTMDLLCLSVEAGLDFIAGISKVCEKARASALVDELAFFLQEVQVGASRQQALRNLSNRCAMTEMSSFSALLIQADILGASVGPVLRAQADLVRTQRFQRAERMGAYATQKLLFPLVLCIMPAVFIVIFGPIFLNFIYGTGVIGG